MQIFLFNWSKLPVYIALLLATVYGGACLLLLFVQEQLIFVPSSEVTVTPQDLELDYEDVWLPIEEDAAASSPEAKIHGWWIESASSSDSSNVLLYLHGNGGNVSANLYQIERFHKLGFSVLAIDYRGYGKSSGPHPNESRVYEDAQTALNYLMGDRGISPDRIFLYGHSLGGAIAIETATRNPNLAALIVQGSFTSMSAAANTQKLYSIFPLDLLVRNEFDSIEKVRSLSMPILFVHGLEDRIIPASMSEQLYGATSAPKQLHLVPEAGHNDVASVMGDDRYFAIIREFLEMVRSQQSIELR